MHTFCAALHKDTKIVKLNKIVLFKLFANSVCYLIVYEFVFPMIISWLRLDRTRPALSR